MAHAVGVLPFGAGGLFLIFGPFFSRGAGFAKGIAVSAFDSGSVDGSSTTHVLPPIGFFAGLLSSLSSSNLIAIGLSRT